MIPAIDSFSYHRFFGQWYQGLETDPGLRISTLDFIEKAKALGAEGVSLESCFFDDLSDTVLDELRLALDGYGLERVWAWGHPNGLRSGTDENSLEDLASHIRVAKRLGADVMRICAGGRRTRPQNWTEHKANLLPMIRRAADAAEREGVVLAVENHLDLFADELVELLETIASPHVAVCFDTANNVRLLEDPLVVARKLAPYARATHIKDVVAFRGDPKVFTSWPSVPAGKGIVNLTEILEILRATGYRGLLALEIDYLHPDYGDEEEALESGMTFLKCWAEGPSSVPSI